MILILDAQPASVSVVHTDRKQILANYKTTKQGSTRITAGKENLPKPSTPRRSCPLLPFSSSPSTLQPLVFLSSPHIKSSTSTFPSLSSTICPSSPSLLPSSFSPGKKRPIESLEKTLFQSPAKRVRCAYCTQDQLLMGGIQNIEQGSCCSQSTNVQISYASVKRSYTRCQI